MGRLSGRSWCEVSAEMLYLDVRGRAFDRGMAHGQRFSALIHEQWAHYQLAPQWEQEKWRVAQVIEENLSGHLPEVLEELKGIADGVAMPLRDLIALNYWIEVLQATVGYGCSLIAFTRTPDGVILGKNSDHDLAAVRYLAL